MSMNSFHARSARPRAKAARPPAERARGQRADALLVERGLAPSRAAARRLIEAGRVFDGDAMVSKAAQELPASAALRIADDPTDEADRYVSRGGIKLAGALARSRVPVGGRVCLDIGQSTGGFTDCLLQHGAAQVVGVDVGHGQLHPKLAADPRVLHHEGVNARALEKCRLWHPTKQAAQSDGSPASAGALSALAGRRDERRFDLIVADVSFISLTLIVPQLPPLLAPGGDLLLLVKPQFEVGAQNVGKGGIVRDASLYAEVEAKLRRSCAENGLAVIDWFASPLTGADGNREFFIHAKHEND